MKYLPSIAKKAAWLRALGSAGLCLAASAGLQAQTAPLQKDVHEEVIKVPASVKDAFGREVSGDLTVTVFHPDGPGPHPLAIISHGRSSDTRSQYGRQRYESAARFLLRKGFVVAVPLRLGYGETAALGDPEDSVSCGTPRYGAAAAAAAQQILRVAKYLAAEHAVDPTRLLLMGQSVGGFATIAAAALRPPGLVAAVNFAGGHGGSPTAHRGEPCQASLLTKFYARLGEMNGKKPAAGAVSASAIADAGAGSGLEPSGASAEPGSALIKGLNPLGPTPTLWIYTENDQYFAPKYSRAWAEAYAANGGQVDYRLLPAIGDDGHRLFIAGNEVWQPLVDEFLIKQGFTQPGVLKPPAPSGFAALADEQALPVKSPALIEGYRKFLQAKAPRAFVLNAEGQWGYSSGDDYLSRALSNCQRRTGDSCYFYAVNDDVVWKAPR